MKMPGVRSVISLGAQDKIRNKSFIILKKCYDINLTLNDQACISIMLSYLLM